MFLCWGNVSHLRKVKKWSYNFHAQWNLIDSYYNAAPAIPNYTYNMNSAIFYNLLWRCPQYFYALQMCNYFLESLLATIFHTFKSYRQILTDKLFIQMTHNRRKSKSSPDSKNYRHCMFTCSCWLGSKKNIAYSIMHSAFITIFLTNVSTHSLLRFDLNLDTGIPLYYTAHGTQNGFAGK